MEGLSQASKTSFLLNSIQFIQFKHAVQLKDSLLEEIESSTNGSGDISVSPKEESTDPLLVLKMAEVKYQKELELEELERQMFELNLKKKKAIVQADLQLTKLHYEKELGSKGGPTTSQTNGVDQEVTEICDSTDFSPQVKIHSKTTPEVQNVVEALSMMKTSINFPAPELIQFSGDPMDYNKFIHNFECKSSKNLDVYSKVKYLIQFCQGEAKSCIEDCALVGAEKGYKKAKQLLYDYYERPDAMGQGYAKHIVCGPSIHCNDTEALVELTKDLVKAELTLSNSRYMSEMNSSVNLRKIVRRLPNHLSGKWVDHADHIMEDGREPNFGDLTRFVKNKAKAA